MKRLRGVRWRFLFVLVIVLGLVSGTGFPWIIEPMVLVAIAVSGAVVIAAWRGSRRATAVGLAVVLLAAWALFYAPGAVFSSVELREEAFDRIHYGMTQDEVEALLGGPPGNYGRYAGGGIATAEGYVGPRGSDLLLWTDDDTQFEVAFVAGRVVAKHQRGFEHSRSITSRIRRILEFRTIGRPAAIAFDDFPGGGDPRGAPRSPQLAASVPPKRVPIPIGRPPRIVAPQSDCSPKLITSDARSEVRELAVGADGGLWFSGGSLGRLSLSGHLWAMGIGGVNLNDLVRGPDGALWFTDTASNAIRRVEMDGLMTTFLLPTRSGAPGPHETAWPAGITAGVDGALWFVESSAGKLGRIMTDGEITEYPLPDRATDHRNPEAVVTAFDGSLWFTQPLRGSIGRFDPTTKRFSDVRVPTDARFGLGPTALAAGPDGIWFTLDTDIVGRITRATGDVDTFFLGAGATAGAITVGPDGHVWVLDDGLDRVVHLDRSGKLVRAFTFNGFEREFERDIDQPRDDIVTGPDGAIWFTLKHHGRIGRIGCTLRIA